MNRYEKGLLSSFPGASSLNSKTGQDAWYAWSNTAASRVYAALPAEVGLLITRFRRIETKGPSHFGLWGTACNYISK
jgi:hypothetical protein